MAHLGVYRHRDTGFGTAWTVTQLLVLATIGGFSVAAWGIYKATWWWERLAVGSAILGFAPLIPYWLAASAVVGGGTVAQAWSATWSATP